MNTPELPDDVDEWPADPFAVLGVRPGDDDAVIKRACTRLIRRFKPEHHPDQFRRVREAYETCLERSQWYRPDPGRRPGSGYTLPGPGSDPIPGPGGEPPESSPRETRPYRAEPAVDPAERAWAAA